MKRLFAIALVLCCTGCNVFYGVDKEPGDVASNNGTVTNNGAQPNNGAMPQECTSSCTCSSSCTVDCAGCSIECEGNSCTGAIDGGSVTCDGNSTCEMGCAGGSCEFDCTNRDSICYIDCAAGATCRLLCGTNRPGPRADRCEFVNCDAPTDCGGGVTSCNGDC